MNTTGKPSAVGTNIPIRFRDRVAHPGRSDGSDRLVGLVERINGLIAHLDAQVRRLEGRRWEVMNEIAAGCDHPEESLQLYSYSWEDYTSRADYVVVCGRCRERVLETRE